MSEDLCNELEALAADGPQAVVERLIESLRANREYDRLFDALMIHRRLELGVSVARPTAFDDIPDDLKESFQESYIDTARKVGQMWIDHGDLARAWVYFRTIGESEPIRAALDELPLPEPDDQGAEELLQIALYDGAHPARGLEILLQTHGTCNTITTMDQQAPGMDLPDRQRITRVLVDRLYDELVQSLQADLKNRLAGVTPPATIRELITGREFLFEGGNYHIDVSHLAAVIRFARSLPADDDRLEKVVELVDYGSQLDPELQYPHEVPFDDFYAGHREFFNILTGADVKGGFAWFEKVLRDEPDPPDQQLIAYVMVDVLARAGEGDQAVALAREFLSEVEDPNTFSFARLCQDQNQIEVLQAAARQRNDPVAYAAALIEAAGRDE